MSLDDQGLRLVHEFHRVFGVLNLDTPDISDEEVNRLRVSLLNEELDELEDALGRRDMVEVLDALIDLQYVLDGAFWSFGMAHLKEAGLNEVHASNMSKLFDGKAQFRTDGKILKGPLYRAPDLERLL
jgi:predicted HAD superfamily Cof-like phosphohydrolase